MKKIGKGIGKFFLWLFVTIIGVVAILAVVINTIVHGPSGEAKSLFVKTMLETGQMKWVVGLFLSSEEVDAILRENSMGTFEPEPDPELIEINPEDPTIDLSEITVEKIEGNNFSATMMIVNDPERVFVGTTYPWGTYGQELDKIVNNYGAVAGINGGLYYSAANQGGRPYGPVVSRGEIQNMSNLAMAGLVLIGMTEDNKLDIIDIAGYNEAQVRQVIADHRIRDAVTFQDEESDSDNHFVKLIITGEKRELNGMGSGANPRTAIGQTKDGRMLLLVTTGRGANGQLGATASDLIEIMASYGAVNAANLDGGSSTSMYYNGEWLQNSVTFYYATSSWRLPDAFLVSEVLHNNVTNID